MPTVISRIAAAIILLFVTMISYAASDTPLFGNFMPVTNPAKPLAPTLPPSAFKNQVTQQNTQLNSGLIKQAQDLLKSMGGSISSASGTGGVAAPSVKTIQPEQSPSTPPSSTYTGFQPSDTNSQAPAATPAPAQQPNWGVKY